MATVLRAGYEPQPMFDRRAAPIYAIIGIELALSVLLYSLLGMRFDAPMVEPASVAMLTVLCSGFAARRAGFSRIALWLEATALAYLQGFVGLTLLYPATVFALPYGDWWLSAADRALGFDYVAVFRATADWPLAPIYRSFNWQVAAVIPLLVIYRRDVWAFVAALTISLSITMAIYPFAPAVGPNNYYHIGPPANWTHIIEGIRDHGVRTITEDMFVGIVSMPSYHATCGALIILATWPVRALRWPFLILNVAMILSAIPHGQHYAVDIIGGIIVAAVSLLPVQRLSASPGQAAEGVKARPSRSVV